MIYLNNKIYVLTVWFLGVHNRLGIGEHLDLDFDSTDKTYKIDLHFNNDDLVLFLFKSPHSSYDA